MVFYVLRITETMNTMQQQTKNTSVLQFSTFYLGDELFGVEAFHVQEILPYQKIAHVPLAPAYIKGLINLRGQIVTVLELRRRLELKALEDETSGANVIVTVNGGLMSLFVDQIGNIFDIHADRLQPPPGTARGVAAHYIQSVSQLEEELLIVLNLTSILTHS